MAIVYPSVRKMIRNAERRQLALGIPVDGIIDGEIVESAEPSADENQHTPEAVSRAIVTTLNEPYGEANRRAWANITRPVEP